MEQPGKPTRPWWQLADEAHELGFSPYLNLIYLLFVFLPLFFAPHVGAREFAASIAATILFLPLYVAGYRLRRRGPVLGVIGATALLGFLLIPLNPGGNCFLIYAIATAAWQLSTRAALGIAVALLAAMAVEIAVFRQPWPFLLVTAVVGAMVAASALYGRAMARRNAELRLSQDEVRRLARTAERERIGRDLHDLLGHTLSLIALKSELARKLFDRDAHAARGQVEEVERIARDALGEVRRAVTGIRAAGLAAELANARLALHAADVRLDYTLGEAAPDPQTETVLSLAVREAVTNVIRHAGATRVGIALETVGERLRLSIRDDGRGGPVEAGNGLDGMRERIAALGGSLRIEPREPGLELLIEVPFEASPAATAVAGGRAPSMP